MNRRARAVFSIAVAAVAAVVAGCGTVAVGPPIPGPPTPAAASPHGFRHLASHSLLSGRSHVTGKSAQQTLTASVHALNRVHSFEFAARGLTTNGSAVSMSGAFVVSNGAAQGFAITMLEGAAGASIREVDGFDYVTATDQFWLNSHLRANLAQLLANRWIKIPASRIPQFDEFRDMADPSKVGRCTINAGSGDGVPVLAGHATVRGARAVVISDRVGGTIKLYVSDKGAPLPLLETQTGPAAGGGTADPACGAPAPSSPGGANGFGDTTMHTMTTTFGDYDAPLRIVPPSGLVLSVPGLDQA